LTTVEVVRPGVPERVSVASLGKAVGAAASLEAAAMFEAGASGGGTRVLDSEL